MSGLDVLMDPETGDLRDFNKLAAGIEVTAQSAEARLLTHLGDWPLDVTQGIDWSRILQKRPADMDGTAAIVALELLDMEDVVEVLNLSSTQNGDDGGITADVITVDGVLPIFVDPQAPGGNASIVVGGILGHSERIVP